MIPLLWIKGIVAAIVISMVTGLGYLGYSKVKNIGYVEAETKYLKVIEEHNIAVAAKIDSLEKSSNELISVYTKSNSELTKTVNKVVYGLKGKTLTIVKNGECLPTKTFSDSFNEINRTVNQNMKESQK